MDLKDKESTIALVKEVMSREFSPEQTEIITHYGKPLNCIAGAGSGKTTVSIGRILYLMIHKGVQPHEILSITFSKKASLEIEERYEIAKNQLNRSLGKPRFNTFHAFFYSILRATPEYRGVQACSHTDFLFDLLKLTESSGVKTEKEMLEQYMKVRGILLNYSVSTDGLLTPELRDVFAESIENITNYEAVITHYNYLKRINNKLDFDDMQTILLEYLSKGLHKDSVISGFQKSYKHIILDEYQDISQVQVDILDKLMSKQQIKNLLVVGDDDQCQPEGTKVMLSDGSYKDITFVEVGEKVTVSKNPQNYLINFPEKTLSRKKGKEGFPVLEKTIHLEKGAIKVYTSSGKQTKYSKGHITYAVNSLKPTSVLLLTEANNGKYVLTLDRINENRKSLHTVYRDMVSKNYKKIWLLASSLEKDDFAFVEKCSKLLDSFKQPLNTLFDFSKTDVENLLDDMHLMYKYPLLNAEKQDYTDFENEIFFTRNSIFPIRCCNLDKNLFNVIGYNSEKHEIYPEEIEEILYDDVLTKFISLNVKKYHNYIADDVLTHNCIYSFRGSQSEYIINFLDRYKYAQRKFISINYRCKTAILNEIIPMIAKNDERVDKNLHSFNSGGTVKYLDTDDVKNFNLLKDMLLEDITSKKDLEKEVAILVRFNKSRMLLADKLAEEGVPVDIKQESYLLQNNPIYKMLFEIARALKAKDVKLLSKHRTKLLKKIPKSEYETYIYSNNSNFFDNLLSGRYKITDEEIKLIKDIITSENAYVILSSTWKLVLNYYQFMVKAKRINRKELNAILKYILGLAISNDGTYTVSWKALLEAERFKKNFLIEFIGKNNVVKIYTIHAVKGLEFNKVYIYDLTSEIISYDDLRKAKENKEGKNQVSSVFEDKEFYRQTKVLNALENSECNVEEERRILHVACTRAIDELILCYSGSERFALLPEMATFNKHLEKENTEKGEEKDV